MTVLTHADVHPERRCGWRCRAGWPRPTAEAQRPAFQPVLGEDRVHFQGEPVVAIAAETPERAAHRANSSRVEYEEMPGGYDPLEPIAPGAPQVHAGGNLLHRWRLRRGDVGEDCRRADVTVEHTYHTPFIDHAYMETETGVGWIDAEGVVVPRHSTQVPQHFRDVADVLRSPAQPRPDRGRVPGRRLRREGRRPRRVPAFFSSGDLSSLRERMICIGHGKRRAYVIRYRTPPRHPAGRACTASAAD